MRARLRAKLGKNLLPNLALQDQQESDEKGRGTVLLGVFSPLLPPRQRHPVLVEQHLCSTPVDHQLQFRRLVFSFRQF